MPASPYSTIKVHKGLCSCTHANNNLLTCQDGAPDMGHSSMSLAARFSMRTKAAVSKILPASARR